MTAYAYIRVSTDRQQESTRGIRSYIEAAEKYADAYELDLGAPKVITITASDGKTEIPSRERVLLEDAKSASKTKLTSRPVGRWLSNNIKPGDTIIFPKMSRGFRNVRDCLNTVDTWEAIGVNVVFLNCPVQGKAMLALFAAFDEWESETIAERSRESHRASRLMGKPQNSHPDPGFTWVGTGKNKRMVPCPKSMAIIHQIQRLRKEGMSYEAIASQLNRNGVKRETWGRTGASQEWSHWAVRKWDHAGRQIEQVEKETGITIQHYDQDWIDRYNRIVAEKDAERREKQEQRAKEAAWKRYKSSLTTKK